MEESLQVTGVIDLNHREILSAPISGQIVGINIAEGDTTYKGQALVTFQSQEIEDLLEETQYDLDKKKRKHQQLLFKQENAGKNGEQEIAGERKRRDQAAQNLKDVEYLYNAGGISKKEYLQAEEEYQSTETALLDAQYRLQTVLKEIEFELKGNEVEITYLKNKCDSLRKKLAACNIFSPFDEKVLELKAELGSYALAYSNLIKLADLNQQVVNARVSEKKVGKVEVGQPVIISIEDHIYKGKVDKISGKAEEATDFADSTINVKITFIEPPVDIIPGMTVLVDIELGVKKDAFYLPRGEYLTTGRQIYVYRVIGQKAYRTPITYGLLNNSSVEVVTGLEEGDPVIVSGYQDFIDLAEISLDPKGGIKVD